MLRRLRRLKISLATKSQLLFGIAAGIIILAALVVTWQRIEQLTQQQDTVAAETLAKQTMAMHSSTGMLPPDTPPLDEYDGLTVRRPRIVGVAQPDKLTPFEAKALGRFTRDTALNIFGEAYESDDGRDGYLLALAARFDSRCAACHQPPDPLGNLPILSSRPSAGEVTQLSTRPIPEASLRGSDSDVEPPIAVDDAQASASDANAPLPLVGIVSVEIPSQIKTRQRLLNRAFLITASLVAAATATVTLFFILTRLILYPMRVLQETAEKVREGDLDVRCDIPSGDEFQTLGETFNAMLEVIQARNEELRRANISLDERLGQLASTNVALDESNRLKSEFIASVSHELRTPLNSILGFADLLKEAGKDNPKIQRFANNIHASGASLLELINDLLDLAKIEAGRMELRIDTLSLADMFEALVTLLGPLAARKQLRIDTRIDPDVPLIRTDAGKLQQILFNLLSNAIKFSPTGGRIALEAARHAENQVGINVVDQGPGIQPDMQQRIFERFRQLDAGVTRQHGGTGLGLAISRELAELLGGTIGVQSVPGEGARFSVVLPLHINGPEETRGATSAARGSGA